MLMLYAHSLFDLPGYAHRSLFSEREPVWSALRDLKPYMNAFAYQNHIFTAFANGKPVENTLVLHRDTIEPIDDCKISFGDPCKGELIVTRDDEQLEGASVIMAGAVFLGHQLFLGHSSLIEGGATIKSPAIIGNNCEVRQGAYLRGYCLVGDRCVIGHTTEVKHSIFLNDAKASHFAYLGDSILGNRVNLGAGTKCANLRFIPGSVKILYEGKLEDTGMRKFGAILGDNAQTGCNTVTSPGTILGKGGIVMPNTTAASGYHEDRQRIR